MKKKTYICQNLICLCSIKNFFLLSIFFLFSKKIPISLPCIIEESNQMIFREWKNGDELIKGKYGILEPSEKNKVIIPSVLFVPLLAFDDNGNRLGYGGGYYDDFLVNHPLAKKIGIFYPFQEVEHVPLEPHDLKLDEILVNKTFTDC